MKANAGKRRGVEDAMTAALTIRPVISDRAMPPSVRVVPAPRSEPPTDDELREAGLAAPSSTAPLLPLAMPGPPRAAVAATRVAVGGPAGGTGGGGIGAGGGSGGIVGAGAGGVGLGGPGAEGEVVWTPPPSPARSATRVFLATCVEVIAGFRPMAQLRPLCLPDRFTDIADRLAAHPATSPASRSNALAYRASRTVARAASAPPRVPRINQTGPVDKAGIRRVQICDIGTRAAEVAVVLGRREEVWAMALRFELRRGQWLCSLIEIL
jgi:hypothetical protein